MIYLQKKESKNYSSIEEVVVENNIQEQNYIIKSISPDKILNPYEFKILKRKVYSFEGLIYYFYNYWEETIYELFEDGILNWINNELKLEDLYKKAQEILKGKGDIADKFIEFINIGNIYNENEINKIYIEVSKWQNKPKNQQYKKLGDILLKAKEYRMALQWYNKAQKIEYMPEIENNIAVAYTGLSLYDKALTSLEKAYKSTYNNSIKLNIIKLRLLTNDKDTAINELNEIIINEDSYKIWYETGRIYKQINDCEKALTSYLVAYDINENDQLLEEIISCYVEIDIVKKAKQELIKFKNKESNYYYLAKSKIVEKEEGVKAAIQILEKSVMNNVDGYDIHMRLTELYKKDQQFIKAIENISYANNYKPDNVETIFEMALLAKNAGNINEYYDKVNSINEKMKNLYRGI